MNHAESVLILIQDLMNPKPPFEEKYELKDITPDGSKSEVKKTIMSVIISQYIERQERLTSNMN